MRVSTSCEPTENVITDIFDHRQTNTVLDRGQRVEEFKLANQVGFDTFGFGQTRKAHQRRCANGVDDAVVNLAAKLSHVFLARFCIFAIKHMIYLYLSCDPTRSNG